MHFQATYCISIDRSKFNGPNCYGFPDYAALLAIIVTPKHILLSHLHGPEVNMISSWLILTAVSLRLFSGVNYFLKTLNGQAKPNPITWFCWALTALVAFAAQIFEGVGPQAITTLALAIGPLCIFVLSMFKSRSASNFTTANLSCGILSIVGVVLWQMTDNPIAAIVFSILADIFGSIPTLAKLYKDPKSEPALPYALSIISMILATLAITDWSFIGCAYTIYIIFINVLIFSLTQIKVRLPRPTRSFNADGQIIL